MDRTQDGEAVSITVDSSFTLTLGRLTVDLNILTTHTKPHEVSKSRSLSLYCLPKDGRHGQHAAKSWGCDDQV